MVSQKDIPVFKAHHRTLLLANEFICLLPHPHLREYIANYNITFPSRDLMSDCFTIMPCGCSTISVEADQNKIRTDLHGSTTKPYITGSHSNLLHLMVTIEFKPAGLYALTGISQHELLDKTFSYEMLNPVLSKSISEIVEKAECIHDMIEALDFLLLSNIYHAYPPELKHMLRNIRDCSGDITVKKLSGDICYSERHLNRIFRQHVGTSVKSFSRLVRVNNAFRLLKKSPNNVTMVSDLAGFYDLSHFIHDFRSVCGITPQEYHDNMSDFYSNTIKF